MKVNQIQIIKRRKQYHRKTRYEKKYNKVIKRKRGDKKC